MHRPKSPPHSEVPAIILAAGLSRRAAPYNKLLLPPPDGSSRTVIRATVQAFCGAKFTEVIVVTGHERAQVETALIGLPVRCVFAPEFARGMGCSLAAGVRAANAGAAGFAISPGDLPLLSPAIVRAVVASFQRGGGSRHVIPLAAGQRGHPVIIGGWLRTQLASLSGDVGARELLASAAEKERTEFLELGEPAILRDVDFGPPPAGQQAGL